MARRLHGGGLFARRPLRCVPLTPAHRRRRSLWCREHRNWRDKEWGRVLFTDESRFSLSSDSHRILIWRERGSRNHTSNIIERDRYGGRGVLVWGGIMLGSRTDLHIFDAGSVNGTRYCNEILLPYVRLFRGAMGLQFLFMDDNASCHRTVAAEQLLETLETINTRFPPEEWLHIYTDGSLLDFAQGAGIGVFSHLFSFYLHAGPLTIHFDGEVEAIHIALQQLVVRLPPIERAVILSDSTSALQALSNYNKNNCLRVQNSRELLGKIKGKIVFQWVSSHCASRVARDKPWSTLCKKSHGIPSSPRAAAVAKFRLLTGHDCLCAHLFRFNLVTSPICVLCDTGQDMTAAHLDECSALNDLNCIVKRQDKKSKGNGGAIQHDFMLLTVRYATTDNNEPDNIRINETFLGFIEAANHTAKSLESDVLDFLNKMAINLVKYRGQGYDGAANKSGVYGGLQKLIKDTQPRANYVHCSAQNLNLILNDACNNVPQEEAIGLGKKWDITPEFEKKRHRKVRHFFDDFHADDKLQARERLFEVDVFKANVAVITTRLKNRFESMNDIYRSFSFLSPKNIVSSTNDLLYNEASNLQKVYSLDLPSEFLNQIMSPKVVFSEDLIKLNSIKDLGNFLMIQNKFAAPSLPDVCIAVLLFLALPITSAMAERSFSKLKLIKNYLLCTMSEERLSYLSLISIEHQETRKIELDELITDFAKKNVRRQSLFL
ncbi:transposable element Tc1 transposase [Trichonephila clavipes]|nr:transposable element Tc1 transposase [Trichonephila clavipes]